MSERTSCAIVGGGPAGMVDCCSPGGSRGHAAGKHADFLRDFRGDTVHPSTPAALDDPTLGPLLPNFRRAGSTTSASAWAEELTWSTSPVAGTAAPYIAMVPQWGPAQLSGGGCRGRAHLRPAARNHEVIGVLATVRNDRCAVHVAERAGVGWPTSPWHATVGDPRCVPHPASGPGVAGSVRRVVVSPAPRCPAGVLSLILAPHRDGADHDSPRGLLPDRLPHSQGKRRRVGAHVDSGVPHTEVAARWPRRPTPRCWHPGTTI